SDLTCSLHFPQEQRQRRIDIALGNQAACHPRRSELIMNFSSIKLGVAIPSRPMRQTAYFEGRQHRVWSVLRQRLQGVCSRCLRVGSLLVNQEVDTGCTPLAGGGGGPAEAGPPRYARYLNSGYASMPISAMSRPRSSSSAV